MVHDYKNFLENWTVREAVNHLKGASKYRFVLNEACSKVNVEGPGKGTRIPLIEVVKFVPDKVLFELYESYRGN